MNNQEAKFILNSYRPGGRDAGDPVLAEALAQARRDPALGAWLGRAQAFDQAVAEKLRAVAAPAALRGAILAGAKVSAPRRAPAWRPWRLALAAGFAVLLGAAGWWRLRPPPTAGRTLPEFAMNFVARGFLLRHHSADVAQLEGFLAARHAPLPAALPIDAARLRALGCRTVDYDGKNISLICFQKDGHEFHLFVARRTDFPNLATPRPQFASAKGFGSAAWGDRDHVYVFVSSAGVAALKEYL